MRRCNYFPLKAYYEPIDSVAEYLPYIEQLTDDQLRQFYRDMVVIRRFDIEAANLQRQGQLALWVPEHGPGGAPRSARRTRPARRTTSSRPIASTSSA